VAELTVPRRRPPPAPIRTDGSNAFAAFTMKDRVPRTIAAVIESAHPARKDALSRLADEVTSGAPLGALGLPAPDHATWARALHVRAGETWLATDWFFAEAFVYRRIVEACRWWETGDDPFAAPKREELASPALWDSLGALLEGDRVEDGGGSAIDARLLASLWGNRIDLSYRSAASLGTRAAAEDLLSDERPFARAHVRDAGDVHVILDNAGSELAFDTALIASLLAGGAARVVLHLKAHPTFVSDAVPADVWALMEAMRARGAPFSDLAGAFQAAFDARRVVLAPDLFWCSPSMFDSLPPRIADSLAAAALVISKGDANYRRLLNDARWPAATPFAEASVSVGAPILALRTLKSDALAGVDPGVEDALDARQPGWRTSGRYGIIQCAAPPARAR
jgi:uncharacterized protein with ATP-grasp and redox domains